MNKVFKEIYREVYNLFPEDNGEKKLSYVRRNWIFPNHINIMLELAKKMCEKYNGDYFVCSIAIVLHDTGLAYKRDKASSEGHEERSIEYSSLILNKYDIDRKEEILSCIKATEPSVEANTINEKIVRSSDAMSQFLSVHFFAKAAFSGEWDSYVNWFEKKVKNNFKKICLNDEVNEIKPIKEYMEKIIAEYKKNISNQNSFL